MTPLDNLAIKAVNLMANIEPSL